MGSVKPRRGRTLFQKPAILSMLSMFPSPARVWKRYEIKEKMLHPTNMYKVLTPGLQLVGPYTELKLKDLLHDRGMYQDLVFEGPDGPPERLSPGYRPPEDYPKNNDNWRADGLFIVAAQREEELKHTVDELKGFFHIDAEGASAKITLTKEGQVRNADGKAQRRTIPDEKDETKTRFENLRGKEQ